MDDQILPKYQSGASLLVVEDEEDYRNILSEKLESEGFIVQKAENGQVALEYLKNNEVDLILLDMLMPSMDGTTFFYNLKNVLNKNTPVIILTNYTDTAYPGGVVDFVIKTNTSLSEVVEKVKKYLPIKL